MGDGEKASELRAKLASQGEDAEQKEAAKARPRWQQERDLENKIKRKTQQRNNAQRNVHAAELVEMQEKNNQEQERMQSLEREIAELQSQVRNLRAGPPKGDPFTAAKEHLERAAAAMEQERPGWSAEHGVESCIGGRREGGHGSAGRAKASRGELAGGRTHDAAPANGGKVGGRRQRS